MHRLRIVSGPRSGESFALPDPAPGPVTLGRGHDAAVRLPDDATLSRVHAELVREASGWVLVNHSQHGTWVGRKRVDGRRPLAAGDRLTLGETELAFEELPGAAPRPGHDPLTPVTPSIAAPPSLAGFDDDGVFHMGQTVLGVDPDAEGDKSFVSIGGSGRLPALRLKRRRLVFFGILGVLGLLGALLLLDRIVLPTARAQPDLFLRATLFALVPVLPCTLLIKALDRNDQIPWSNLLACIGWGGTVGCGFALALNGLGGSTLARLTGEADVWGLTAIVVAPVVEEVVKGLAVLVLLRVLHDEFDNVVEGLVLGAASGLGFALVENVVYNVGFLARGGTHALLVMGTYRLVLNGLVGHPVYTAMTGAGFGLMRELHGRRGRWFAPVIGLALAIGLHMAWNAAALTLGARLAGRGAGLALALEAVVVGGAGLAFFAGAWVLAQPHERRVLVAYLAEEVDRGFVAPDELRSFDRVLGRQRWELEGLRRGGLAAWRARRALRRAQVELGFRKWHLAQGDRVRGQRVDAYVLSARTRIRDARNRLRALEA